MPVSIEMTYSISIDDSSPWKIKSDSIRRIGGDDFVKIKACDQSLVNMIRSGVLYLPKNTRLTLAQRAGYTELVQLRNDAVIQLSQIDDKHDDAARLLFGARGGNDKPKEPRTNASELQRLRGNSKESSGRCSESGVAAEIRVMHMRMAIIMMMMENMWLILQAHLALMDLIRR